MAGRALISKLPSLSLAARSTISSPLRRLRPLLAAASPTAAAGIPDRRRFSAAAAAPEYSGSLLNYPPPEGGAPEKEDPAFDGMDFEHWLVILEDQDPTLSRDQLIDSYVKTFAKITGSEEEAKKKMYSVSTKHYFAFGVLVEEEVSYKIKNLPGVKWVLPDSYINRETKDYGGEPFIQGQAVPYDPKYHEEWLHSYHTSKSPPRDDQPRNFPRGNENMDFQNRDAPPMPNQGFQSPPEQGDRPPMNSSSNVQNAPQMPISEFNGVQPNTPARTYPKQTPLPQSNYAPTGPAYQGNGQNYQAVNPGPAHQGNEQRYQGGYQQGDGRNYQQDGFPGHQHQAYQSGPSYPPNRLRYQQGGQGVDGPAYQQGGQGVSGPGYQGFQSSPQQGDRPPLNSRSNVRNAPQMPNREFNGVQPNTPARTYPNQTSLPQSNYAPTGPAYQGNGQYQVVNPGPAHQGSGQGYQGGYERGDGRNYQQDGFPGHQQQAYQFGPNYPPNRPNYPPNRPSYQQGGQGVGGSAYQQGGQGVSGPGYQGFQSPPLQGDRPPMKSSSNVLNAPQMPNSEFTGVQPNTPARTYPNQRALPQNNYAPTGPAYQGNGQNYQVVNPGPAHQGSGQGCHGGYQQGDGRNYQQDGFPGHQQQAYQSGPNYPPNRPSYQQGGQRAGGPGYQRGGQDVSGPGYQQGARGVSTQNYQGGQGVGRTNVPGRDY